MSSTDKFLLWLFGVAVVVAIVLTEGIRFVFHHLVINWR